MKIDYESLGKRIRKLRRTKILTQAQLAELAEMSENYLCKIETGNRSISLDTIVSIANALEVSIEELLVDSLMVTNSSNDNDLSYILLDCTNDESSLLLRCLQSMKDSFKRYDIKKKPMKAPKEPK